MLRTISVERCSACIVAALLITQINHHISFTSVIGSMIFYKNFGIFNCRIGVKGGLGVFLIRSLESKEVHSNQAISHHPKYYKKDKGLFVLRL